MKKQRFKAPSLHSVNSLSKLTGRDRRTLDKALAHVKPASVRGGRKLYHLADVEEALESSGRGSTWQELRAEQIREQTREAKARADLLEIEQKVKSGQLITLEEVAKIVNPVLLTMRQRLNAMPSECAALCNPTDPAHAQAQLQAWVERQLPLLREKL